MNTIKKTGGHTIMNYINTDIPIINYQRALRKKIFVDKSGMIIPLNELIGTIDGNA